MNYDFNQNITDNNSYDFSIEKLIHFITFAYIKTYPVQFGYNITTTNDLYKYIHYGKNFRFSNSHSRYAQLKLIFI